MKKEATYEKSPDRETVDELKEDIHTLIDGDNVTEEEIEAFKEKIDELLADKNMGEAEKAKLNEYKSQADNLIEIIHTPVKYFSLRFFCFIRDCFTWKYNGIFDFFSKLFSS